MDILLPMIFDAGYKAGAEDAGSGKLLIEAQDLRYALYRIRCRPAQQMGVLQRPIPSA